MYKDKETAKYEISLKKYWRGEKTQGKGRGKHWNQTGLLKKTGT